MLSARRLTGFGVLALVAGAAGAQAAGGGSSSPKPHPPRAVSPALPATPAPVAAFPGVAPYMAVSTGMVTPINCRLPGRTPAAAPPSEALKSAFGILRRERTDDDALPERALRALKQRGLQVVDPQATRLLRADRRARAWVVPVPDVAATPTVVCRGAAARARARALGAAKPREGLAVVSVGGAPPGGGGSLRDLERGVAAPSLDPCAGAGGRMFGVSGIVPDGVAAVFVTSADGSATRADVHDNGYAFVLPRSRRPEARYVVWTGANGTPHVQPLPAVVRSVRTGPCGDLEERVRVTPEPWASACAALPPFAGMPSLPPPRAVLPARLRVGRARAPRPRRGRGIPARPLPAPLPFDLAGAACAPREAAPLLVPGRPARAPPPRAPRAAPAPGTPASPKPAPPRAP